MFELMVIWVKLSTKGIKISEKNDLKGKQILLLLTDST